MPRQKLRVASKIFEKFLVAVGVHQESVLSPLLFATVVDVITENVKEDLMNKLL